MYMNGRLYSCNKIYFTGFVMSKTLTMFHNTLAKTHEPSEPGPASKASGSDTYSHHATCELVTQTGFDFFIHKLIFFSSSLVHRPTSRFPHLQFIPNPLPTEIRHGHDLHDQASPAGKVLRPLALTRLRVVLLPRKTSLFPAFVHRVNEILAEVRVELRRLGLMWTFLLGNFLS
jgi:hypothetical protein